jgi:methylated-DNA-[protein]-cysteine S-methyltransferase
VLDKVAAELEEYFSGRRTEFTTPIDLRGTPFQRAVWEELLRVPYGELRSYGEVAKILGRPRAARAVGTAVGANPIPVLVPCHRIIEGSGGLGGFGGGLQAKRELLALERARLPAGRLL